MLLKRFPRLSETFVLNEIRGLERLGVELHILSLLPPEDDVVHAAVAEVASPVTYFPTARARRIATVLHAHVEVFWASPLRYFRALTLALWWALQSPLPLAMISQFWRAGFVAATFRRAGVAHVHAHFAHQPAAVAGIVRLMTGIPYSFTAHAKDLYLQPLPSLRRRCASASFIATCTQHNVDYLRRNLPAQSAAKVRLIYHGIDLDAFAKLAPRAHANGVPEILSVGRLVPKKGMSDLIVACARLRDRHVAFTCTIVGAGPLHAELRAQIDVADLSRQVHLAGAMAQEQLVALYRTATVFALAPQVTADGDRDGIPNVLVEAMAARVPVISTEISGIPELIEHDRNGLLVPPRDPGALAAAILQVFNDSVSAAARARLASQTVKARLDCWSNVCAVARLLGCKDLLDAPGATARAPRAWTPLCGEPT